MSDDNNTTFQIGRTLKFTDDSGDKSMAIDMSNPYVRGLKLDYDLLTTPKYFHITPLGIEWSDGTSTYNTGLGRLCAVQQAFSSVEFPPDALTLKINDKILLTDGTSNKIDFNGGTSPNIVITDNPNGWVNTISGSGINPTYSYTSLTYNANYNSAGMSSSVQDVAGLGSVRATTCDYANGLSYEYQDGSSGNDTTIKMYSDSAGYGYLDCKNNGNPSTINFLASSLLLNGSPIGGGGSQDLSSVLSNGNNAGFQSITNLNDLGCSTINGTSYPPPNPSLSSVLSSGNGAYNSIDMTGNDIYNCNNIQTTYINGLSPVYLGLNWGDFFSQNAYNNLPSNKYGLDNSIGSITEQSATSFYTYNNGSLIGQSCATQITPYFWSQQVSSNEWLRYDWNGGTPFLRIGYDYGNGATLSEVQNGLFMSSQKSYSTGYNWVGRFVMEADAGLHIISKDESTNTPKPILLEGSNLLFNGSSIPLTVKTVFGSSWQSNFSISSGSFYNVLSQPLYINSGNVWSGSKDFILNFCFNVFNGIETTGSLYIEITTSAGSYQPTSYSSSYPLGCYTSNGFNTNQSIFNFTDLITFNSNNDNPIYLNVYVGHNGGFWSGDFKCSISLLEK